MKYSILLLALIVTACHQNPAPVDKSPFVVRTYHLKLAERIREVLFAQGRYYCLLETGKFICLNRQFQVDSTITQTISNEVFERGFLGDDQLMAAKRIKNNLFEEYFLDEHFQWQKTDQILSAEPAQAEEPFQIHHCCMGEFGGAIFFKDKRTERVYSCPATCVVALNKIGNDYYVTNTLAHSEGFSEILLIKDPKQLFELKTDSLKNSCNWWTWFVHFKDGFAGMEKFEIGTTKLLDTIGLLTTISFVRDGELYHLCSDQNRSFVGKLNKGHMQMLDSIFTQNLRSYLPVFGADGDVERFFAEPRRPSGFFAIHQDTISVVTIQYNRKY